MVQRRSFILTALFLLIAGVGAHAQLPDGTIKISGIRPAEVRFTSDGRYFMAKLSDTLRIYETATGVQAGGIPVPKVDGYAAGFLAGDSTVLVMRYNWGLYYHVWNWRKGILVDSQKVWRTVQWAHVLGSGRKMVIKVSETTDPTKQYEMWNTIGEATYLGSFLDKTFGGRQLKFDSAGENAASLVVNGSINQLSPLRLRIRPREVDMIQTIPVTPQPFREHGISPDGRRITVTRAVGLQRVFDTETLDSLFVLDLPRKAGVNAHLEFTSGHRWLVCGATPDSGLPSVQLFDGNDGSFVKTVATDTSLRYMLVYPSPDARYVVLGENITEPKDYVLILPLMVSATSVDAIVGVRSRNLSAYPNPAGAEVGIEYRNERAGSVRIQLLSTLGQVVLTRNLDLRDAGVYRERFALNALPIGQYFVVVQDGEERQIEAFVKNH